MRRSLFVEKNLGFSLYSLSGFVRTALVLAFVSGTVSGCVSSEKYEAEKARALNFQRLLAQEEKRTGELNVKYQEIQKKSSSLESQNRDISSEMDALREQLDRAQQELTRVREGGGGSPSGASDDLSLAEPSISEFGLEDIEFKDSDFGDLGGDLGKEFGGDLGEGLGGDTAGDMASDTGAEFAVGTENYHTVAKGETLYRISRQYGVSVQDLKDWNNLSSNLISVGQQLIVSGGP